MPNTSPPNRLFALWAWGVSCVRVNRTALINEDDGQWPVDNERDGQWPVDNEGDGQWPVDNEGDGQWPVDNERDGPWFSKSRAWWSCFPTVIGNVCFRFRTPRLRVLPTRQWIQWEQTLNSSTRMEKSMLGDRLLLKTLSGQPLDSLFAATLNSSALDIETALDLIGIAVRALKVFHQRTVGVDGQDVLLSHGDASIANVMIDQTLGSATWFDFDLQHDLAETALTRQADDLRALVFTSAPWFGIGDIPRMIASIRVAWLADASVHEQRVWAELERLISGGGLRWDLFHQAQCRRSQAGRNGMAVSWAEIHRTVLCEFRPE